jgi:hypothetical protein
VADATIHGAIAAGKLRAYQTAGDPATRLLLLADVQAWIDAGKRGERRRGRPAKAVV